MTESLKKSGKKMKFKLKVFLYSIIILIVLILIFGRYYLKDQMKPFAQGEDIKDIEIIIEKGSTAKSIGKLLEENNIIKNRYVFRILVKLDDKGQMLKAGKYIINNGMTPQEVLDHLISGGIKKQSVKFTIPEGFELRQIADRLSGMGLVDKERFINLVSDKDMYTKRYVFLKNLPEGASLEGYLFPDTYEVYKDATEEDIIDKMLSQFDKIYNNDIKGNYDKENISLNELITLASIIEREAKVDEERRIISGVFYNRLEKNMKLQSCATVQYALGDRKSHLSNEDLEIKSNYNTYMYNGLPPGPIATAGLKSIKAALYPENVDYLYFVLKNDGSGSHIFSTNYRDHINAKNKNW